MRSTQKITIEKKRADLRKYFNPPIGPFLLDYGKRLTQKRDAFHTSDSHLVEPDGSQDASSKYTCASVVVLLTG